MKKFTFILASLLVFFLVQNPILAEETDKNIIKYEKDGRVKPIPEANTLSEKDLNNVLEEIGVHSDVTSNLSKTEKENIAEQGGKAIDVQVESVKKYYTSFDGTRIKYTKKNLEKIKKQKVKDLKTYNKKTGKNLSIMKVEPTVMPTDNNISTLALKDKVKINGKLEFAQQVIYLGSTTTAYKYLINTNAAWNGKPLNQKTDGMGVAWDKGGVAVADTFKGNYSQETEVADGKGGTTWISSNKALSMTSPQAYGHGVKVSLGGGDFQNINMQREMRASKKLAGDPAYLVAKYHHTHLTISGISISIGIVSVDIAGSSGDDTVIEYSYYYGDK
ncbi:hypothetical protein [Peribacillus frigoritolerans]|uniref:hypothetical protein n=1 Tax=Peribacillus frigoritolerans TaxID=450367 RepID=UPI0039A1AB0D